MQVTQTTTMSNRRSILIRAGGLAIIISFAIHIAVNFFLKEFPPTDPTIGELTSYLEREAETWALVHGLRYLAIAGISIFLAGLYARTTRTDGVFIPGWEIVGLIGGVLHLASLFITNGIETFAFLDFELLSAQPELFWLVFNATRVLFTAEVAAWSLLLFGFSLAGWQHNRLPKLISGLGFLGAAACLLSGVFIGSVLMGGWAELIIQIAEVCTLLWFASVGVFMIVRGDA